LETVLKVSKLPTLRLKRIGFGFIAVLNRYRDFNFKRTRRSLIHLLEGNSIIERMRCKIVALLCSLICWRWLVW
jgi:hypothetical protein